MGNTKIILLILSEIPNILWKKKLRKFILCYMEFVNCKKLT